MEPNINKFCLICKDTDAPLKLVSEKEHLCPTCLSAYEKPPKEEKPKEEKSKKEKSKKEK